MKGVANIRLTNGRICLAEVHWYQAHGILMTLLYTQIV